MGYYDGTKLLSLKDENGLTPEVYICTSNRSAGKTTYFNRMVVNRLIKKKHHFGLLYRYNYELDNCADKFFKDIKSLFFKDYTMTCKSMMRGKFMELRLNNEVCGYALAINDADALKKYSHFFSTVQHVVFDEFQTESGKYCPNEIVKFHSLHVSIARGGGEQVRYVPIYMISNPVSLLNPYYAALNISHRIQKNTHFLKGDGFVMECGYNEDVANKQTQSAFNRAFKNSPYLAYAAQGIYLNDDETFIQKPEGRMRYMCSIKYGNKYFSVKEITESGFVYCDSTYDASFPIKVSATTQDMELNYINLKAHGQLLAALKFYFDHGLFRFRNLECKKTIMDILSA